MKKIKYTEWYKLTDKKGSYSPEAVFCDAVVDGDTGKVMELHTSSECPQVWPSLYYPLSYHIERNSVSLRGVCR
jgi:hypothetical protein